MKDRVICMGVCKARLLSSIRGSGCFGTQDSFSGTPPLRDTSQWGSRRGVMPGAAQCLGVRTCLERKRLEAE